MNWQYGICEQWRLIAITKKKKIYIQCPATEWYSRTHQGGHSHPTPSTIAQRIILQTEGLKYLAAQGWCQHSVLCGARFPPNQSHVSWIHALSHVPGYIASPQACLSAWPTHQCVFLSKIITVWARINLSIPWEGKMRPETVFVFNSYYFFPLAKCRWQLLCARHCYLGCDYLHIITSSCKSDETQGLQTFLKLHIPYWWDSPTED